ncbi:MAG TPA: ATP-binding protein [Streptosporangiaceae bacterium]|nr:ATP-binding protein [Streptosporangiaceae bacterium]
MVHMHRPATGSVGQVSVGQVGVGQVGVGQVGVSQARVGRTRADLDPPDWAGPGRALADRASSDWGFWSPAVRRAPRHDHWQRLFRGQESELRQLRRWLCVLLPDTSARDDLISVAVELGTNAIQHTASGDGGWFTVEVACLGPVIRVAVTDEGAPAAPRLGDDPLAGDGLLDDEVDYDSDCGRGLLIVQALSAASGVCGNVRGRTVWAEVAVAAQGRSSSPSASSAMASSRTL